MREVAKTEQRSSGLNRLGQSKVWRIKAKLVLVQTGHRCNKSVNMDEVNGLAVWSHTSGQMSKTGLWDGKGKAQFCL